MAYSTVPIAYLYAEDDYWRKYMAACEEIGWARSSLITNWLNSYCSVNRVWLQNAAELDATARGYSSSGGEYFVACRDWGDLKSYAGPKPVFADNPLATTPKVPTSKENRRSYQSIRTSGINAAFFRLICEIEQDNKQAVLSRVAVWHVNKYWDRSYRWQLEASGQESFTPEIIPV